MKIATVEYTGRTRNKTVRGPRGLTQFGGTNSIETDSMEEAEYFESKNNFDVDYTTRGLFLQTAMREGESLREALQDIDYQTKRKLVNRFDIETESRGEEALEEALADEAETLIEKMRSN